MQFSTIYHKFQRFTHICSVSISSILILSLGISYSFKTLFHEIHIQRCVCFKLLMHAELSVPLGALTFLVYHFHYSTFSIDFFSTEKINSSTKIHFIVWIFMLEYYHKIIKKCCTLVFVQCSGSVQCEMCIPTLY